MTGPVHSNKGQRRTRMTLSLPARDTDWDASGSQLLFTDGDRVHHYGDGKFRAIPRLNDVDAVAR